MIFSYVKACESSQLTIYCPSIQDPLRSGPTLSQSLRQYGIMVKNSKSGIWFLRFKPRICWQLCAWSWASYTASQASSAKTEMSHKVFKRFKWINISHALRTASDTVWSVMLITVVITHHCLIKFYTLVYAQETMLVV